MKTNLMLAALAVLIAGCSLFEPEPLPAYLIIPELQFTTDYSTQGTESHRITEVWVFANARMVGAYELPATVPILADGPTDLQLFPGIKNNGKATFRQIYPLIGDVAVNKVLEPLRKDTIVPHFTYRPNASIILVDDFETANVFRLDDNVQGTMEPIAEPSLVFEGERSLHLSLSETEVITRIKTNEQQYQLPGNRLSWLEMNYRCDNTMAVGLEANGPSGTQREFTVVLGPTTGTSGVPEWRKVYIELLPIVSVFPGSTFELVIEAVKDQNNSTANLWFDNFKIVYF